MSGQSVAEFMAYWEAEGKAYVRRGDYDWMASLVPGQRVLEIGSGLGFSSAALIGKGLAVLAVDSLPECLAVTRERCPAGDLALMQADLSALSDEQRAAIASFQPDTVVCWLMGAPAEVTGAKPSEAGQQAVAAYREKMHRLVAELAAELPTVQCLHLVDRTVIPWQAKDIGRDTLVRYHNDKTLLGLPFAGERRHALYRKIEDAAATMGHLRKSHPSLKGVVPTLASLLAERKK
ncbi:class I SAM-dependent methyltransferase [Dechloromonas sp. XY25]|uniref:Class I SAM-dependent methyltransferase n=1 Tax=Dechloromonas hankyongensis TaxID=2908002 RepID=A0ABS9K3Y0_9RHOO|nr:class I SAM-dependent methyltransferase [Dechloromonas hankyongensis]MCG2577877.1 class I SAM-dependent methyltransferase [Dechloromonas hankyongensis]